MEHAQPRGLNRRRVEKLLLETQPYHSASSRIEALSRHFLGKPYLVNPLIGSAERPEVFVASLDGFDCVTYVETIVALARASCPDEFSQWLRRIRYKNAQAEWKHRNHYMTQWIRNNARSGLLRRLSPRDVRMTTKQRVLDIIPKLPPVNARFGCVPKPVLRKLIPHLQTGDLIFFSSTRKHLDIFHCGIIVRDGDAVRMRHASRSRGSVVEQELQNFMSANRMAGVIVMRPTEGDLRF